MVVVRLFVQDVVLCNAMDAQIVPYSVVSCPTNGLLLRLQPPVHLVNWALENYAHRHLDSSTGQLSSI